MGACDGYCCVAKRFDRPFRLPVARSSDPDRAADTSASEPGRSASREDCDGGADGAAATAPSGADELTARFTGLALIEDDDDCGEEETEEEEAAARSALIELLDAVPADDGGGGDRDGVGGGARHREPARCDTASLRAFARDTLPQLVHLSHRRERHCRVMLQHRNADALAWRLHDLILAGSASSTEGAPSQDPSRCEDESRELASLLVHNLSVAASSKEPRDEDRFKTRGGAGDDDDDDDDDTAGAGKVDDDGEEAPMLSLVNHPTWEGILRALFDDVERLVRTRESAATGGMRSVRRERRARARADDPAGFAAWVDERKNSIDGAVSDSESDSDDADDAMNDAPCRVPPKDHDALCRGRLGTAVGALLAVMEPDSARPRLLAMDGGGFFRRVFRAATKILPARHGDASLDAVGVMHRLLWIRPDATTTERETLMRALVDIDESPVDSSSPVDFSSPVETSARKETEIGSTETRVGGAGDGRDGTPSCDPKGRWTWSRERGYENAPRRARGDGTGRSDPDKPGELRHRPATTTGRGPEGVAADSTTPSTSTTSSTTSSAAQAEAVSVNGVLAALRSHLPPPTGVVGLGLGAAGGSLACTQALHVLRALFEDLGVLEAQRKYGRRKNGRGGAGDSSEPEALWRQLRTDQLRDLVMQLTVVIEVLGQPPKARKKDKDDGEKKEKDEKKEDGEKREEVEKKEKSAKGREVDGFWIPDEDEPPASTPPSPGDETRPGGGWDEWRTVIPKEGECDGAVGAAVGIINALCTHPVLFHVIDGHPRLDDLIRAVTRASASQCSCAWATFSCVVNLSSRAARVDDDTTLNPSHELGDALLSSPAAGHLLRGLRNAVCDRWPIMSLEEMPDVRCLPPPDSPERAARRREREERRKRREEKRNKRPRRDTWKEKTPKEKAKERRREARRREKEARGGKSSEAPAEAEPLRVDAAPAGAPGLSTPSDVRPEEPLRSPVPERLEATDESEDETDDDAEDPNVLHPNDPLANPANRLLLRTTAAAALCSLARVQRRWDEQDLLRRVAGGCD